MPGGQAQTGICPVMCRRLSRKTPHQIIFPITFYSLSPVAVGEQFQPQGIELDKAFGILLVILPGIIFKGHNFSE